MESTSEDNNVVITEQDLLNAIDKLILQLDQKRKRSAAAALRLSNNYIQDNKLVIEVAKHESKMLEEMRIEFLQYFRVELKHAALQLEFVVVAKSTKTAKAFTAKDKLRAMTEKNPAINKLFEAFNLELDD